MNMKDALATIKRRVKKRLEANSPIYSASPNTIDRMTEAVIIEVMHSFDRHADAFTRQRELNAGHDRCFKSLSFGHFFVKLYEARAHFKPR